MLSISATPPSRFEEVLSLLLSHLSDQEKIFQIKELLDSAKKHQLDLSGLIMATKDSQVCGAALSIIQPDDSAFVWSPVVNSALEKGQIEDQLFQFMGDQLDAKNVWMGQCIVDLNADTERQALIRNRFDHVSDLVYMHCHLSVDLPEVSPESSLQMTSYNDSSSHERFKKVLERTYIDTSDCDVLNELRTLDETLYSHQLSGDFLPEEWNLFHSRSVDAGLLLMNDHPDQKAWEVVYIGVVPEARGQGFGREIILAGLNRAKQAGREQVILAVDAKNSYAYRIYESLGFLETTRKSVHIRQKSK